MIVSASGQRQISQAVDIDLFMATVKYNKLKKIKNDLDEDVFGLNIALEVRLARTPTKSRSPVTDDSFQKNRLNSRKRPRGNVNWLQLD